VHDAAVEELRELVRHRDRLRGDFDARVRQLHRLVDLVFPELIPTPVARDSHMGFPDAAAL
jgi:hypothetical protein